MKTVLMNIINGLIPQNLPIADRLPSLTQQIEQARQEWLSAQNYYNNVSDADLVDHAAYLIQAAEKKYTYLLKRARQEGVRYAPFH
ncbi:YaaL family protein [Sporomusa sp.]|uniref:YaaL family protein n=1 Tax=Sporomusa sp. TaxID=2078658 RepID=UPI002D0A1F9C|nr:YaaL family protein [Sporomusa sp.]HWR44270.1 YaaL family protein [Sporomusa sp.]